MGNCCKIIYEQESEQIFDQNLKNESNFDSHTKRNNNIESSHDFTLRSTTDFTIKLQQVY